MEPMRLSSRLTVVYARLLPVLMLLYGIMMTALPLKMAGKSPVNFSGLIALFVCGALCASVWLCRLATVSRTDDELLVELMGRKVHIQRDAIVDFTQIFVGLECVKVTTRNNESFRFIAPKHLLWPWQDNPDFCAMRQWARLRPQHTVVERRPAAWMLVAPAILIIAAFGSMFQSLEVSSFPARDASTQATVQYCRPKAPESCRYVFTVADINYEGHTVTKGGVGSQVQVSYDSHNPENNFAGPASPWSAQGKGHAASSMPSALGYLFGLYYAAATIWFVFVR